MSASSKLIKTCSTVGTAAIIKKPTTAGGVFKSILRSPLTGIEKLLAGSLNLSGYKWCGQGKSAGRLQTSSLSLQPYLLPTLNEAALNRLDYACALHDLFYALARRVRDEDDRGDIRTFITKGKPEEGKESSFLYREFNETEMTTGKTLSKEFENFLDRKKYSTKKGEDKEALLRKAVVYIGDLYLLSYLHRSRNVQPRYHYGTNFLSYLVSGVFYVKTALMNNTSFIDFTYVREAMPFSDSEEMNDAEERVRLNIKNLTSKFKGEEGSEDLVINLNPTTDEAKGEVFVSKNGETFDDKDSAITLNTHLMALEYLVGVGLRHIGECKFDYSTKENEQKCICIHRWGKYTHDDNENCGFDPSYNTPSSAQPASYGTMPMPR